MKIRILALNASFALSIAGCCWTSERVLIFERGIEDEGVDCEEICERTLVPDGSTVSYEFRECREGFNERSAPAVLCTFAQTHCDGPH